MFSSSLHTAVDMDLERSYGSDKTKDEMVMNQHHLEMSSLQLPTEYLYEKHNFIFGQALGHG